MGKTLYFEGAGCDNTETGNATVGNCRIRTAFHLDDGRPVFLEISGFKKTKYCSDALYQWEYTGFCDAFYITDELPNDDCNKYRLERDRIEYSESGILEYVNSLGASFDSIKVLPGLGGYRVFPEDRPGIGIDRFNYGDEFNYDPEMIARRETVYKTIYEIEAQELEDDYRNRGGLFVHSPWGVKRTPNFSLWVDEFDAGMLHLLRHFNGYNKHWTIRTDVGDTLDDVMSSMTECVLGRAGC